MRGGRNLRVSLWMALIFPIPMLIVGPGSGVSPSSPPALAGSGQTPGTPPQITLIDFPSVIQADGNPVTGLIFFYDPDGDVVEVRFELLEGERAALRLIPAWEFDPRVRGQTEGAIEFGVAALLEGRFRLRVTVEDERGLSASGEFGFEAVAEPLPSPPCTVTVQPGDSIQEAIDRAEAGAVICLAVGIWWENLTIEKGLSLVGEGPQRTLLQGDRAGEPVIRIRRPSQEQELEVLLQGLTVTGGLREEGEDEGGEGLRIEGAGRVTLRGLRVEGNGGEGLVAEDAVRLTLTRSVISGNGDDGLRVGGETRVNVVNSLITGNEGDGLFALDSARLGLLNAAISDNGSDGLWVEASARVTLQNSQVSGNGDGLFVGDSAQVILTNSQVSGNGGSGLDVRGSAQAQVTLQNSQVSGNGSDGLFVAYAQVTLQNSQVSGNGSDGLDVGGGSARVELRGNISIDGNGNCGIRVGNEEARVSGGPAEMRGNWVDLCGFAPASLRKPLVPETERTELRVPGDYPTLQEAIDAIAPGGTIVLAEGTYQEGFMIWKPLTIQGAGPEKTLFDASYEHGPIVSILPEARGVRLADLRIQRSRRSGLEILGQAELVNLKVVGNRGSGIGAYGEARVTLQNSQASGNGYHGLWVGDSARVEGISDSWISDNGGCGISLPEGSMIAGRDNWVKYNFKDFCNVTPPEGFLRESPPRALLEEAEVCPTCEFTEPWQAIVAVGPGATVRLRAGEYRGPVVIAKDLTVLGEGPGRTILTRMEIGGEGVVEVRDLQVSGGGGIGVGGNARVTLQNLRISDNGVGLSVKGSAQVTLQNSQVSGNEDGLVVRYSAQVTLQNSQVSGNRYDGLWVWDSARVTLENVTVSGNGFDGLDVRGSARVTIEGSLIEQNGTDPRCRTDPDSVCNGIEVWDEAQVELRDTTIRSNTDWGIAAWLKKCGYSYDDFTTGQVIFQGQNTIEGNNRSGDQDGLGNPGNHLWNRPDVPDGQVCLP